MRIKAWDTEIPIGSLGASGSVMFDKTRTEFADNDWGEGAVVPLTFYEDGKPFLHITAELHWIDWNHIEFEEVPYF